MTCQPLSSKCRQLFPNLTNKNHSIASKVTDNYNCIAWSLGVNDRWMWPRDLNSFWPSVVAEEDELEAVIQLYLDRGYEKCGSSELEEEYKKVAIYVKEDKPSHAALQLGSGRWTSKLGSLQDIEHDTLEVLEGESYGKAIILLKKHRD